MADEALAAPAAVDPEQAAVIEAPPSARLSVTAGPGTGKTRTLLARAAHLADRDGLELGAGLLVLSFSRTAVETVSRRGAIEADLGRLPVRTVDSLAVLVLSQAGIPLADKNFDERIEAATKVLAEGGEATALFDSTRHVLVDEAQDVVGVRALFVWRLLKLVCEHPDAGFTVFGDPAQAIFDFQTGRGAASPTRLVDLLDNLATERMELTTNHRMSNLRLTEFASEIGSALRNVDPESDWVEFQGRVSDDVMLEAGWTCLEDAVPAIAEATEGPGGPRVGILCRTNAEALWLACYLQSLGLEVAVRHRAQDRGGAPWLATLFSRAPVMRAPVPPEPDRPSELSWLQPPPDLAQALRHAGLARNRDIDLDRLAMLLRCGACPEELTARRDAPITISTIHRAKGLEYDTVFVVEGGRPPAEEEALEEARVVYVAGTRAKEELLSGAALDLGGVVHSGDRAVVCAWHSRRPIMFEVKVTDSDPDWAPADADEFRRGQDFIREEFSPGDPIELVLASEDEEEEEETLYELVHEDPSGTGVVVGRTTPAFGRALRREVWGRPPRRITGLVAEIPDAAAMSPAAAQRVGLAEHGIHLRARVYGLGRLRWR